MVNTLNLKPVAVLSVNFFCDCVGKWARARLQLLKTAENIMHILNLFYNDAEFL